MAASRPRTQGVAPEEEHDEEPDTANSAFYGDMEVYLIECWNKRHDNGGLLFVEENGAALGEFRKTWASACQAAGVGPLLFHDLRRTAVRNMMDAGIPQSHAMYISGHKTDSIFRRYDIVSDDRLAMASAKMQNLFDEKLNGATRKASKGKFDAKLDAKST